MKAVQDVVVEVALPRSPVTFDGWSFIWGDIMWARALRSGTRVLGLMPPRQFLHKVRLVEFGLADWFLGNPRACRRPLLVPVVLNSSSRCLSERGR